jgi:ribosomal protein S18 acetylase RimI-like enzyme
VSGTAPSVALRPATADDYAFFARVYASTRVEELAPVPFTDEQRDAFLAQQFEAQTSHYASAYPGASFDVVLVDGESAGRLIVLRGEREIRLVDVALLPEWRGRGVGTRLLAPILAEADAAGATVTIHVEQMNRARGLYERLGFERAGEHGIYIRMERQAKTAS